MVRAYHTNISVRILEYLEKGTAEINVAVAWFTNYVFFKVLHRLIERGISVKIIISDSSHNFNKLHFEELTRKNGAVYICPAQNGRFMHNKFCTIDNRIAISGSYNWSLNAEKYFENIIITDESAVLNPLNILFRKLVEEHCVPFSPNAARTEILESEEVSQDNYYYGLQEQFEKRVDQSLREALKIGVNIDSDSLYELIKQYGAVGAAKLLTSSNQGQNLQSGFRKLARKQRLNLTFEHLVIQPEFRPLFSDEIIRFAEEKLERGRIEGQLP